jgi:hypothetical protein
MSTSTIKTKAYATAVSFDKERMTVSLSDGRRIGAPLSWFPRLRDAKESQRRKWRLVGKGVGIRWDELDEDVSVAALLET